MSRIALIRDFIGAVIVEARLTRGTLARMESKLDKILTIVGPQHEALRADHETLAKQVQGHERRLPRVER